MTSCRHTQELIHSIELTQLCRSPVDCELGSVEPADAVDNYVIRASLIFASEGMSTIDVERDRKVRSHDYSKLPLIPADTGHQGIEQRWCA